jgi:hypothetical protein
VGAPQDAAGLPGGNYVFQVTDPSGKTLLSTDPARGRQFMVSGGVTTGVGATTPAGTSTASCRPSRWRSAAASVS